MWLQQKIHLKHRTIGIVTDFQSQLIFFKSQPDKNLHNVLKKTGNYLKNWKCFFFKQKPRNYTIHLSNLTLIHLTTFLCKFDIESQDLQRRHAGESPHLALCARLHEAEWKGGMVAWAALQLINSGAWGESDKCVRVDCNKIEMSL